MASRSEHAAWELQRSESSLEGHWSSAIETWWALQVLQERRNLPEKDVVDSHYEWINSISTKNPHKSQLLLPGVDEQLFCLTAHSVYASHYAESHLLKLQLEIRRHFQSRPRSFQKKNIATYGDFRQLLWLCRLDRRRQFGYSKLIQWSASCSVYETSNIYAKPRDLFLETSGASIRAEFSNRIWNRTNQMHRRGSQPNACLNFQLH